MSKNKLELIRKDKKTEIKINDIPIKRIIAYKIIQDMERESGKLYLEIKIDIDEIESTISIIEEDIELRNKFRNKFHNFFKSILKTVFHIDYTNRN